jgi:hypothetical protein
LVNRLRRAASLRGPPARFVAIPFILRKARGVMVNEAFAHARIELRALV